ncbi:nucleolar protein 16 isoform X2 [Choloepus didactylus]|uniref:nucleolar protein 16 isoform X2 n=1 Tax=Choloepus didactylus TaxID=27675 RepID=UPI0018A0872A|nr:nucleolar protein 16 isoform X2 [Choloepus didactylus]
MLDGRQRHGSSAPTSDMPGTTLSRCGRTWPRWDWPWTPTRLCRSIKERVCFLQANSMEMDVERPKELVRKPYVLNDLETEASIPEKKGNTLSRDLIDYVRYMVENHGEDYKAMARDEKNYYQDTPKQIRNKINVYKRFYPTEWQAFTDSLQKNKMEVE